MNILYLLLNIEIKKKVLEAIKKILKFYLLKSPRLIHIHSYNIFLQERFLKLYLIFPECKLLSLHILHIL